MIYFSIDNDHHASLAISLIARYKIPHSSVTFISHISPRNRIIGLSEYNSHSIKGHPLCAGLSYKNPKIYWLSFFHQLKIKGIFRFKPDDILVITTEYELNNAIFAKQVRNIGGRVYIYDEGIGFYFNNSPYHDHQIKLIDRFYLLLYTLAFKILGIPAYAKKGQEGRMFVCIKDVLIDKIYSSMNLPVNRKIPIDGYRNLLRLTPKFGKFNHNVAIIFSSNFECFNLKAEEMQLAALAIEQMAKNFSRVYIKVHPSDYIAQNDVFFFYASLKYKNVKLLDNSLTAVQAINKYHPAIVVGSMSTSLFDAMLLGCQPIFLFHLLPKIENFGVYNFTLNNLNYNFITSISDISTNYDCKVDTAKLVYENELPDHLRVEINH